MLPEQLDCSVCNYSSSSHRKSLRAPATSSDLGATGLPAKGSSILWELVASLGSPLHSWETPGCPGPQVPR